MRRAKVAYYGRVEGSRKRRLREEDHIWTSQRRPNDRLKEIVIDDMEGVLINDLKGVVIDDQKRPVMDRLKGVVIDEVRVIDYESSSTRSVGVLIDALNEVYNRMRA